MAVAFLPVFYSKHALNDVVTLAPVTLAPRRLPARVPSAAAGEDWLLAGGAIGAATATKYTAGAMLLTRPARGRRCASSSDRAELRRALLGCRRRRRRAASSLFAILNPFVMLNPSRGARADQRPVARRPTPRKLGQDDMLRLALLPRHAELGARLGCRCSPRWPARWSIAPARLAARAAARRLPGLLLPLHGRAGPLLRPLAAADLPGAVRAGGDRGGRARADAGAPPPRLGAGGHRRGAVRSRDCWRASTSTWCSGGRTPARRRCAGSARTSRRGRRSSSSRSSRRRGRTRCSARCGRSSARSRPTRSGCACARSSATGAGGFCWVDRRLARRRSAG